LKSRDFGENFGLAKKHRIHLIKVKKMAVYDPQTKYLQLLEELCERVVAIKNAKSYRAGH